MNDNRVEIETRNGCTIYFDRGLDRFYVKANNPKLSTYRPSLTTARMLAKRIGGDDDDTIGLLVVVSHANYHAVGGSHTVFRTGRVVSVGTGGICVDTDGETRITHPSHVRVIDDPAEAEHLNMLAAEAFEARAALDKATDKLPPAARSVEGLRAQAQKQKRRARDRDRRQARA